MPRSPPRIALPIGESMNSVALEPGVLPRLTSAPAAISAATALACPRATAYTKSEEPLGERVFTLAPAAIRKLNDDHFSKNAAM
mmetsp:Transcript_1059/g.3515  ORF Transcript_1059/g.3515 Transcript_1059/m.3515 type:complete len:84 (-) Transcript_1059:204-455(-)